MSAQWMLYALAVGLVMTLAGFAAEQSARLARRPARYFWMLAMVCTAGLPLSPWLTPADTADSPAWSVQGTAPAPAPVRAPSVFAAAASTSARAVHADGVEIDQLARLAWQLGSALTFAGLVGASLALRRRKRQWQSGALAGTAVLVSDDAGPAVVGVLRPQIVVPAWLMHADSRQQTLVLAHEQSHIAAGDQRLLAAMTLLLVAMPWNLALWYQLRRLRRAIEIDCDARVLEQGHRLADYGAALIDIGSHASGRAYAGLMAMATASRLLEQRVRLMARRPARWHRFIAPLLLMSAFDIGVAAARIAPPQEGGAVVAVPQAAREAVAGYYQLDAHRVAVVTVSGDGLAMKTNLEPVWRLLPLSNDRYAVAGSDMQVRFDRAAGTLMLSRSGVSASAAPRVDGAAVGEADAWVAARIASGQPLAGGEGIVRRNAGARTAGDLHAADFTPSLLQQERALVARQRAFNDTVGKMEDVTFAGVSRSGWDLYKVRYARRSVTWAIWLDDSGRLAAATPVDARF
jgi:bla regulator protein BlaR1